MHVSTALPLDPNWNWFLQFAFTAFVLALAFLHLLRSTTSKYFSVDSNFHSPQPPSSAAMPAVAAACALCGNPGDKQCARCKAVRYWYAISFLSFLMLVVQLIKVVSFLVCLLAS